MAIVRTSIGIVTGASFEIPAGTSTDNNRVWIFREGSLVPWDATSLTRTGNVLTITPALSSELIDLVEFT